MVGLVDVSLVDADHQEDLVEFDRADAVVESFVESDQGEGKLVQLVVAVRNYVVELISLL